ncbi:hypothetical protein C3L33_11801, partial [Rhododendron williamsianum]
MGPSILSIPQHILMEILSKLPMTTICNCRCVCSYLRNLISDPEFAQLHLSRSQPSLMLCSCYPHFEYSTYLVESFHIPTNTLLKFEPKCEVPTLGLKVLSSCNGLICFYGPRTYNPYVICNPFVDEYVIVPQMEKYSFDQRGCGLPGLMRLEAEINTVGTNLWRGVRDAPLYLHSYSDGCFLNGALHWIVHDTENCFESMHCFEFGKEQFQPFPGPSQFYRILGQLRVDTMKMGVLKDHLSISHNPTDDTLDIWVMKDYAVQDSWRKILSLKPHGW